MSKGWRRGVWILALGGLVPAAAPRVWAREYAAPLRGWSVEQVADGVLAAIRTQDPDALFGLAACWQPDPWIVAEDLLARREWEAADLFARAAPRPDVAALPGYVAARKGKPGQPEVEESLRQARAASRRGEGQRAVALLDAVKPEPGTVPAAQHLFFRGAMLRELPRLSESAEAYLRAAGAARDLGWLFLEEFAADQAGLSALAHADYAQAHRAFAWALTIAERRGDGRSRAIVLEHQGVTFQEQGDLARATACFEQALEVKSREGDRVSAAITAVNLGRLHAARGERARALGAYEGALRVFEEAGVHVQAASVLNNLGVLHGQAGDIPKALDCYQRALGKMEAEGDAEGVSAALDNLANVHQEAGRIREAIGLYERALRLSQDRQDRRGTARSLGNLGCAYESLGVLDRARELHEGALRIGQEVGDPRGISRTLANLGNVYRRMGDYAKALDFTERAIPPAEAAGDQVGVCGSLQNLAALHAELGDPVRALRTYKRALRIAEEVGGPAEVAGILGGMGNVHQVRGEHDRARQCLERALALEEELGHRASVAGRLFGLGTLALASGDREGAIDYLKRARQIALEVGDPSLAARALGNVGSILGKGTEKEEAVRLVSQAAEEARAIGDRDTLAINLVNLSWLHLLRKEPEPALSAAEEAVREARLLARGLSSEQGATAQSRFAGAYEAGARSADQLGRPDVAVGFLESGRARALLEAFESREALGQALPEPLRIAEAEARAEEKAAVAAFQRAVSSNDAPAARAARGQLTASQDAVREVVDRIERAAKGSLSVLSAAVDPVDRIQARLEPGEVLVLYGWYETGPLAGVVSRDALRVERLPEFKELEQVCEAARSMDPARDPTPALEALRAAVVAPLRLGEDVRRVLLSPDGLLAYVPLGLLFGDRQVAYVPSGTILGLLRSEEPERGTEVLAVGDPDYSRRVPALEPLPATAAEATTVGDVVLLGDRATEAGIAEVLGSRPRWRALHLACHGVIDPERPGFCRLELAPDARNDGSFTALEILRSRIPADLVVLSACQTGQGKVVEGEGLVGLTRACMSAGASRVLCSLWAVPDEATRVLMERFHALWNPRDGTEGRGAAEALRAAQEAVRATEREVRDPEASRREGKPVTRTVRPWQHPHYWAAWVLWGLPE